MDKRLASKLSQKSTLNNLQRRYQQDMVVRYSGDQNIFYMLINYDPSIGYTAGKQVYLYEGAWSKIHAIVKTETGFDLLYDTVDDLASKGRVDNALTIKDEKALSTSPFSGFLMCRIIGESDDLMKATGNPTYARTPNNTYVGIHVSIIKNWCFSALVFIENFAAFMAFDDKYLAEIHGFKHTLNTVIIVYRGHDKQNIYSVASELSKIATPKYIFSDYDLAGLSLSEVLAIKVGAIGYILPTNPKEEPLLTALSKKSQYDMQAATIIHDRSLTPFYKDIKSRFIATTQEAIMAQGISVSVVDR